jgi:transposase
MYIETVPNRNSPPAILLRESYREDGKVKKRTLANLSSWSPEMVDKFQALLRGEVVAIGKLSEAFEIVRSSPHGHVVAVLGTLRRLKLEPMLSKRCSRKRNLAVAMVVARIIAPGSKLALARSLDAQTATSTMGELLGVESATELELYEAMDWLLARQTQIEQQLASRHLAEGTLVLYDLSSTYFEGHTCSLATLGYSRDGKKGTLQIVFGLLCDAQGCPVAVEVFEGNTADSTTLKPQIQKLRFRFGLKKVVLVGDRGMITQARITEELKDTDGLDWITALRSSQVQQLFSSGALKLSLFDNSDWIEIHSEEYPNERLIACRNSTLAQRRERTRQELLAATESELDKIVAATVRAKNPLQGKAAIGLRVGKVINHFKMAKHFRLEITDESFHYERNIDKIVAEAMLDGIYVIRTSLASQTLAATEAVRAYKSLSQVEQAFRSYKSVDLKVRPIFHRLADRVKAHIFLCMLAYYVEWHMRQALAPMLFDEDDPQAAESLRQSIVAPAQRSNSARHKAAHKLSWEGSPVHSFQSMLADLATVVKNRIQPKHIDAIAFDKITQPTPLQQKSFELLGLTCTQ